MKAIVYRRYGPPDALELCDVDEPEIKGGEVLVRVLAAAVNPGDWDLLHGTPYVLRPMIGLRKPRNQVLGSPSPGAWTRSPTTWPISGPATRYTPT